MPAAAPLAARRIQIARANGEVPPPLRVLFAVAKGKARVVPVPQAKGFYVVKVNKIIPGNAMLQPDLISRVQSDLHQQFPKITAISSSPPCAEVKVQRNESAIAPPSRGSRRAATDRPALDGRMFVAYTFPVRSYGE